MPVTQRPVVYELDRENWRDSCRMKFQFGMYMKTWIEQVDARYRGIFGSATGFGYRVWFDDLETALRWANAEGGGIVVSAGSESWLPGRYHGPYVPTGIPTPDHLPGQQQAGTVVPARLPQPGAEPPGPRWWDPVAEWSFVVALTVFGEAACIGLLVGGYLLIERFQFLFIPALALCALVFSLLSRRMSAR